MFQTSIQKNHTLPEAEGPIYLLADLLAHQQRQAFRPDEMASRLAGAFPDQRTFLSVWSQLLVQEKEKLAQDAQQGALKEASNRYANVYELFAYSFPEEERSPIHLLNAAQMARNSDQFQRAVAIYDYLYQRYPDHPKRPQALFFKRIYAGK